MKIIANFVRSGIRDKTDLIVKIVYVPILNYKEMLLRLNNMNSDNQGVLGYIEIKKVYVINQSFEPFNIKELLLLNKIDQTKLNNNIEIIQMSYTRFFLELDSFKLKENSSLNISTRTMNSNMLQVDLCSSKVIFIFDQIIWSNVVLLFKLCNISLSGGSITNRHKLNIHEYILISFISLIFNNNFKEITEIISQSYKEKLVTNSFVDRQDYNLERINLEMMSKNNLNKNLTDVNVSDILNWNGYIFVFNRFLNIIQLQLNKIRNMEIDLNNIIQAKENLNNELNLKFKRLLIEEDQLKNRENLNIKTQKKN